MIVPSCADQLLQQLLMEQFDILPSQCRHNGHMHVRVWFKKCCFFCFKMLAKGTQNSKIARVRAQIVPTFAEQLLPQLLLN